MPYDSQAGVSHSGREEVENRVNFKEEETKNRVGKHGNWSFKVKEKINEARMKQKQREEV